ncbi:MAG: allantoinase AllB [Actinobacteria bacterium]|nr:allantoinase AllB [Actinomycetota bacterium]
MTSIKSSRVVLDGEIRPATIMFGEGVVVDVGAGPADRDYGDKVIMSGLVDSHVHVNEPGRTDWEGFATATRAAAAGGTTTIVDMPLNSVPPTVSIQALAAKRYAAEGKISVDVAFWGGYIPGSESQIRGLAEQGVCGFKSFLVDSGVPEFPPVSVDELRDAMKTMATLGVPALVHGEEHSAFEEHKGDARSYGSYLASRPADSEARAVEVVAELSEQTGAAAHVLHVSSGDSVGVLARGPETLTGETCPHYLTFSSSEIPDGATQFKCSPPIREASHREALWEGLRKGTLAMVVSDHSPAPADLKELDSGSFESAWGGIASLQIRLPVTWSGATERGFDPADLAEWLSAAPARLAGLDDRKGSIDVGKDADFVVWDPDGETDVRGIDLQHRHPITPYEGMRLRGRVLATILHGETICEDAAVTDGRGSMLARR